MLIWTLSERDGVIAMRQEAVFLPEEPTRVQRCAELYRQPRSWERRCPWLLNDR